MDINNTAPAPFTIATHSGSFHADDVFATAVLLLALAHHGGIRVVRTRNSDEIVSAHIAVDVGAVYDPDMGRFDHHQRGGAGPTHEVEGVDPVPKAAFGLVWAMYGEAAVRTWARGIAPAAMAIGDLGLITTASSPAPFHVDIGAVAQRVAQRLVLGIDAADVGRRLGEHHPSTTTLSQILAGMNPRWYEDQSPGEYDRRFVTAVGLALKLLQDEIAQAAGFLAARDEVLEANAQWGKLLVLERFVPWQEHALSRPDQDNLVYCVFRAEDGTWMVQQLPKEVGSFEGRKPLPEKWAGLRDAALAQETGVADAIFCHPGRFICGARTREGALALADLALLSD